MMTVLNIISIAAIPSLIIFVLVFAAIKGIKIYEVFVEGAKEGFQVAVRIIPYLVAMLVAIGIFRAGGAMEMLGTLVGPVTNLIGMSPEVLPLAILRPLSGSGALGVFSELVTTHGPDSLIGRMASVMMGSTETTFYVMAVYFGSVSVYRTRHAVPGGLIADFVGLITAVFIANLFFG
jgi:spore maturation protein B